MRGTCQRCGCTEEHACEGGCGWADDQEDLCTECAAAIVREPIPGDLAGLHLHYRAFAAICVFSFARLRGELAELRQLMLRLAAGRGELEAPVHSEIWTPGDEL